MFLELAKPDTYGFSRKVYITEFVGKYKSLTMGNGGDWCRYDGGLAKKFLINKNKEKNKITSVELVGRNNQPINKAIKSEIKEKLSKTKCRVLNISNVQIDHKNGRYDSHSIIRTSKQELNDFQGLSKAANMAKRQHCKVCKVNQY